MKKSLLVTVLLVWAISSNATYFTVNGINYNTTGINTVEVVGTLGVYKGSIVIPSSVTFSSLSYNVTSIGTCAFYYCSELTSITLPSTIVSIGTSAFEGCSRLASFVIPPSITSIGSYAFRWCTNLSSITIPLSVTSIGSSAFYGCSGLTAVTIFSAVTTINTSLFSGCTSLASVTIPSSVISIGNSAFYGCTSLSSVTIPSSVTSIGNSAFSGCTSLIDIAIPPSVVSIGTQAFSKCYNLSSVLIPASVTTIGSPAFVGCKALISVSSSNQNYSSINGVLYNKSQTTILYCPTILTGVFTIPSSVTSIGPSTFSSCKGLSSVLIPPSVLTIGSSAFYNCNSLSNISLPPSLTSIGSSAFSGCISLTEMLIPSSVTTIGAAAFLRCRGIKNIEIPSSVTSIGEIAFLYGVTNFIVSSNNPNYSSDRGVLYNKDKTKIIQCPYNLNGEFLIPSTVTSIEPSCFDSCTALKKVVIPPSVTNIGYDAFYYCSGLTNVSMPQSLVSIGDDAFYRCTGLTAVTIPSTVISIGNGAYSGCVNLKNIYTYLASPVNLDQFQFSGVDTTTCKLNIPVGTKSLYQALLGWKDFKNIEESLLSVGNSFTVNGITYTCNGMNTVQITSKTTFQGNTIPENVNYLGIDYIPTTIGNGTFEYFSNFANIIVPPTVISIGNFSFQSCNKLTNIELPSGMLSIGNYAFYNCTALSSIKTNTATPPSLGTDVFSLVDKAKCTLYVPKGSLAAYKSALQWKEFLNIVEFTSTGINQIELSSLVISPSIATNRILIKRGDCRGDQMIFIFNSQGQELKTVKYDGNDLEVDVSSYPSGVYYVKVIYKTGSSQSIGKFIKR